MLNTLTEEERAEGWTLLFDGKSMDQWRGFRQQEVPEGWEINDDSIHYTGKVRAGDIICKDQYADFELRLEWKVLEAGNSGIFFRVSEEFDTVWYTGPEMQVLDDARHRDGAKRETSAGANYALHPPAKDVVNEAGEWNQVGIVARGNPRGALDERREDRGVRVAQRGLETVGGRQQVQGPHSLRARRRGSHRRAGPQRSGLVPEHQDQKAGLNRSSGHEEERMRSWRWIRR